MNTYEETESTPNEALFLASSGQVEVQPKVGAEAKTRPFEMIVNTGEPIRGHWYWGDFIFDLSGLESRKDSIPVLREHDVERVVGFTEGLEATESGLSVKGQLVLSEPDAQKVANLSDASYPWQASMFFTVSVMEEVQSGETVEVNGREYAGPMMVMRKWRLREVSFCTLGADEMTHAQALGEMKRRKEKMGEQTPKEPQQPAAVGENKEPSAPPATSAAGGSGTPPAAPSRTSAEEITEHVNRERERCHAIILEASALAANHDASEKVLAAAQLAIANGEEARLSEGGGRKIGYGAAVNKLKASAAEALAESLPKTPGPNGEPGELSGSAPDTEEGWKLAYAKDGRLAAEFGSEAVYLAYRRAEKSGSAKVYAPSAGN